MNKVERPILYIDDTHESETAMKRLDEAGIDYIPIMSIDSGELRPVLATGSYVLQGSSNISVYYINRFRDDNKHLATITRGFTLKQSKAE